MIPAPTLAEQRALVRALAPARLRRFRRAVDGSERMAVELIVVDALLASHLHAAVRLAEVLIRERIHRTLTVSHGPRWFDPGTIDFDTDVRARLDAVLRRFGVGAPPDKVVAELMFGTWVAMLGRGGRRPDGTRAHHVRDVWERSLRAGFSDGSRARVHRLALRLNWARNRINHCEPVVFGFPQPGIGDHGEQVRRTPSAVLDDVREIIELLDEDLGPWLDRWDELDALLEHPLAMRAMALVERDDRVVLER